jgi:hypothetical protein
MTSTHNSGYSHQPFRCFGCHILTNPYPSRVFPCCAFVQIWCKEAAGS